MAITHQQRAPAVPGNVDEVEEYVQQIPGGEERLRKWKHQTQHVRETSRGVEHVNVQEAKLVQTSTVSSSLVSGQLPLPLSFSDAVKHGMLNTETGASWRMCLGRLTRMYMYVNKKHPFVKLCASACM